MLHGEALLDTLPFETVRFSSWARNGGNSDLGYYYGTDASGWKILCDVSGPGALTELWYTKEALSDTARIRIFVNDTIQPVLDTSAVRLCGQVNPFLEPLADSAMSAWFSYAPIPFQNHLRITYRGTSLYYHMSVLKARVGETIESFSYPPSAEYTARLDSLRERLLHPEMPLAWGNLPAQSYPSAVNAPAFSQVQLLSYSGSGVCRRLLFLPDNHTENMLYNIWMRIYTDHYPVPDFEAPLATLFGAAQGWWPYRSVFMGMLSDTLYLNLPIRFQNSLRVELDNRYSVPLNTTLIAEICSPPPSEMKPLTIRGICRQNIPTTRWLGYEVADADGPGNYLGVLMDMQQSNAHVFEGDETIYLNDESSPSWRGTGTEDYFNAGYYWATGTGAANFGCHGLIRYRGANAAVYRWHITDPVPFTQKFRMHFEVGPYDDLSGNYRSMAILALPRERWQVMDASRDFASFPAETLHIVGQSFVPGTALVQFSMGDNPMPFAGGNAVVDADSVLDVYAAAPEGYQEGELIIRAYLSTGTETVCRKWTHHSRPDIQYKLKRVDVDSCIFEGDTLYITIRGMAPHTQANLFLQDNSVAWVGSSPLSDASGTLTGTVTIPQGVHSGDFCLEAYAANQHIASCDLLLRVRPYLRLEIEELTTTVHSTNINQVRFVPDYLPSGSTEDWGRNLARYIRGTGIGAYAECRFRLPVADSLQSFYFFGRTGGGAKIRVTIDSIADVDSFDTYFATAGGWRWSRSDTVQGRWHYLSAGEHVLRFQIIGRNALATSWEVILDQVLFTYDPTFNERMPAAVTELTAYPRPQGIRLRWKPVTTDHTGNPLAPDSYAIYRALGADSLFHLIAEVNGSTLEYIDTDALVNGEHPVFYTVTAIAGSVAPTQLRESVLGRALAPIEMAPPPLRKP